MVEFKSSKGIEMANRNRVLIIILGVVVVLGFVLRKYVVADNFGEHRIFEIACASVLTLVAARFFLSRRRRELKNQS